MRHLKLYVVRAVLAEEGREALVDLDLEGLEGVVLAVDGEVARLVEGLDSVCGSFVVVLLLNGM